MLLAEQGENPGILHIYPASEEPIPCFPSEERERSLAEGTSEDARSILILFIRVACQAIYESNDTTFNASLPEVLSKQRDFWQRKGNQPLSNSFLPAKTHQ